MNNQLLPCPFCGSAPRLIDGTDVDVGHFVRCDYCRLDYPSGKLNSPEKAIAVWNERPGVAATPMTRDESTDHIDWDILAEERLGQRPRSEHGRHIPQTSPAPGCDSGSHSAATPASTGCICCANGNDLPEGEYCRACGRENNVSPLGQAIKRARGMDVPPKVPVQFDGEPSVSRPHRAPTASSPADSVPSRRPPE